MRGLYYVCGKYAYFNLPKYCQGSHYIALVFTKINHKNEFAREETGPARKKGQIGLEAQGKLWQQVYRICRGGLSTSGIVPSFAEGDDMDKWFAAFERPCTIRRVSPQHWGSLLWKLVPLVG